MTARARAQGTPTLRFWAGVPSSPFTDVSTTPFPAVGSSPWSHCAWELGDIYISAVPDMFRGVEPAKYRMQPSRSRADDVRDFNNLFQRVKMPPGLLDAAAMAREGRAILTSNVLYEWGRSNFAPPLFNNAIVAMLVLVAGMPEKDRIEFRRRTFHDPNYQWQSGRSPIHSRFFSDPWHIYEYCLYYSKQRSV